MPDVRPYIPRNPGDPITAEDWNALQVEVKNHISSSVDEAKEEIRKTGVDQAGNSDRFATRSDTEWERHLDGRYAGVAHEHEGPSVYRRYIKRFEAKEGMREVFLEHGIGVRFPVVDIYEILPVTDVAPYDNCKILFYGGHEDRDRLSLEVSYGRDEHQLGLRFETLLQELGVEYDGDDAISDVVQDMWTAFAKDPNDEIEHCQTDWIEGCCRENKTVDQLRREDWWNDLYVAIKPRKCELTCGVPAIHEWAAIVEERREGWEKAVKRAEDGKRGSPSREDFVRAELDSLPRSHRIQVTHVNYDTLHLAVPNVSGVLDLMVLLRA